MMGKTRHCIGVFAAVALYGLAGAASPEHIPLKSGLTLVSALHFPDGDRENVVTVQGSAADGVTYTWHGSELGGNGARAAATFSRYVSAADLAGATRLNTVFRSNDQADYPGYTAFSLSTGVYESLRSTGKAAFTVTALGTGLPGLQANAKYQGTLSLVAAQTEPFSLIVNGAVTTVPSLHLRGEFKFREEPLEQDFWILADSSHPLILKTETGGDVLQLLRVELPSDDVGPASVTLVERMLDKECRAELPGIYFAFGTATLDRASESTLTSVAAMLARHPQWTLSIEGHTDNIGTADANQRLSQQRASAVQMSLSTAHGIPATRLQSVGFGAARPRATNDTMAGRARNRRVELVRPCAAQSTGGNSR